MGSTPTLSARFSAFSRKSESALGGRSTAPLFNCSVLLFYLALITVHGDAILLRQGFAEIGEKNVPVYLTEALAQVGEAL